MQQMTQLHNETPTLAKAHIDNQLKTNLKLIYNYKFIPIIHNNIIFVS